MRSSAMKIEDVADDVQNAVDDSVRTILESLRGMLGYDPRAAFGNPVRLHRQMIENVDRLLCIINGISSMVPRNDGALHLSVARELDELMPKVCHQLLVCRTLADTLSGNQSALAEATQKVRASVQQLLEERAKATASRMTSEELAGLHVDCGSEELEAWLAAH